MGRGEILALLCAMVWAVAVIIFKRVGERVTAFHLNLFKNSVGTMGFLLTLLLVCWLDRAGVGGERLAEYGLAPAWAPLSWRGYGLLCLSGVLGITMADTMLLRSLQLLGAGRMAVIDCLYTPSMIVCAMVMLGDRLTPGQVAGAVLVVSGVAVVGFHPGDGRTRREVRTGILLGVGSMLAMAFALVLVNPMLKTVPLLQFTWIRLAASVVAALLYLRFRGRVGELAWLRQAGLPWMALWIGSALGAFLGMGLWIAGFKYSDVTSVAVLNQTSVFFILILATVVLKETLTGRKVMGMLLGVSGVLLATLF